MAVSAGTGAAARKKKSSSSSAMAARAPPAARKEEALASVARKEEAMAAVARKEEVLASWATTARASWPMAARARMEEAVAARARKEEAVAVDGRLHLDAAETWAVDMDVETARSAVDLESVATHEIGHVLGLGHSSSPKAVMYPSLRPREKKAELTVDDVEGVQLLYGSNPGFSLSSLYEQEASMSPAISSWLAAASVSFVLVILVTCF